MDLDCNRNVGKRNHSIAKSHLFYIFVLIILWVAVAVRSFNLPIYFDSLFTIGAGARLAHHGHFSGTFMLYGLVNAYILEIFLALKMGALAPFLLRIMQLILALTGFFFLCRGFSLFDENHSNRLRFFSAAAVVLSSAVILIESFEPTPENAMLFAVNILFYRMAVYRASRKHAIITGVVLALMVGTRPTSMILWLPVLLIIPEHFSERAYAKKIWRWCILSVFSVAVTLTGFPQLISVEAIAIITAILVFTITLLSIIHDIRNDCFGVWNHFLIILISSSVSLVVLFPNYFLHISDLIGQIKHVHLAVEFPGGSPFILAKHIFYSFMYLTIAFPGPFAATGFFAAIGLFLSKRRSPNCRMLLLFTLGTVPFLILACRNDNFQSRYLIPLMGVVFVVASIGLLYILSIRKLRILLLIPFLVSAYQIYEIVQYKTQGGILNAFYDLSLQEDATVLLFGMGTCWPDYYSQEDNICWLLMPYVESHLPEWNSEDARYFVSFSPPPDQYEILGIYGTDDSYRAEMIRMSGHPDWISLLVLIREPWTWRDWDVAYLGVQGRN
ncbi:MAG: hypothetical protein K8S24_04695 [Candidatus Aegiribacteria sp.]|nr:hypothetical protein [Candidatus Aegiribacteria sp.]